MEQILEIDGAMEFFLMIASTNVNWEGNSIDIERDKLITIAAIINCQFETLLDFFQYKINIG